MRILLAVLALTVPASSLYAQASCSTQTGSSRSLATNTPFGGNSLFGSVNYPMQPPAMYQGFNFLIDVTTAVPLTVDRIDLDIYGTGGTVNLGGGMTFLHPNQVGNTTLVEVYTCATSYVGNEMAQPGTMGSPWTQAGTAVLTVADNHADSIIDFTTTFPGSSGPISLMPGTVGLAIQVHPVPATGPTGSPNMLAWNPMEPSTPWTNPWPLSPMLDPGITAPTSYTDGIVTLAATAFQRDAWTSGTSPTTLTQNIEVHYIPGAGSANWTSFGVGCESRPRMVHEVFPGGSTIDLVSTSQTLIYNPAQGRFVLNQGGPAYNTSNLMPNAVDLALGAFTSSSSSSWDDATVNVPVNNPTRWGMNGIEFPNGSTMDLAINSNGKVYLGAIDPMDTSFATHGSNYGSIAPFQGATGDGDPTLAGLNCDLDPTTGGSIWYEDPSPNGGIRITWDNILNWQDPAGPAAVANFIQIEFVPPNLIHFSYGNSLGNGGSNGNDAIVGFSAGGGQPVSTPIDWSTINNFLTGDGTSPPVLGLSNRPIIGTTFSFDTTNIKSGTLFNFIAIGNGSNPAGMNLGPQGLPNCSLYLNIAAPITTLLSGVTGTTSSRPLTIPASPVFNGVNLFGQGAPLTSGYNPVGIFTTNGICLAVGLF